MPKDLAVRLAESAVRDLEDVVEWYEAQGVSVVGRRLVREVLEKIEGLSVFPDRGRMVPEFNQPWLRELIHPRFRIVYRRESHCVRIVRVWRGERPLKLPHDEID